MFWVWPELSSPMDMPGKPLKVSVRKVFLSHARTTSPGSFQHKEAAVPLIVLCWRPRSSPYPFTATTKSLDNMLANNYLRTHTYECWGISKSNKLHITVYYTVSKRFKGTRLEMVLSESRNIPVKHSTNSLSRKKEEPEGSTFAGLGNT